MMLVQYFRGPSSLYDAKIHGSGIYFTTDTHEIIHNGFVYSGNVPEDLQEVIDSVNKINEELTVLGGEGSSITSAIESVVDGAINSFAQEVTTNGTIDTFKELVDYVAEHKEGALQLIEDVSNIQKEIELLKQKDVELEVLIDNTSKEIDEKIDNAFSWINV